MQVITKLCEEGFDGDCFLNLGDVNAMQFTMVLFQGFGFKGADMHALMRAVAEAKATPATMTPTSCVRPPPQQQPQQLVPQQQQQQPQQPQPQSQQQVPQHQQQPQANPVVVPVVQVVGNAPVVPNLAAATAPDTAAPASDMLEQKDGGAVDGAAPQAADIAVATAARHPTPPIR